MQINDKRSEDSFYFKNSAFIDTFLLNKQLPAELKWCVMLMHAKRLSDFARRNNRFQRSRYERQDLLINYASYSNKELDSISNVYFENAKRLAGSKRIEDIGNALWLSSDPLQFLIKPDLYDITITEQIYSAGKINYYIQASFKNKISIG